MWVMLTRCALPYKACSSRNPSVFSLCLQVNFVPGTAIEPGSVVPLCMHLSSTLRVSPACRSALCRAWRWTRTACPPTSASPSSRWGGRPVFLHHIYLPATVVERVRFAKFQVWGGWLLLLVCQQDSWRASPAEGRPAGYCCCGAGAVWAVAMIGLQ